MLKRLFSKKEKSSEQSLEAAQGEVAEPAPPVVPPVAPAGPEEPVEVAAEGSEVSVETSVEDEGKPKRGFLRGAWETTKRIALTPVDPWFEAVAKGLDQTRQGLVSKVASLFRRSHRIDEDLWDELEEILITADVGPAASERIIDNMRKVVKSKKLTEPNQLFAELRQVMGDMLSLVPPAEEGEATQGASVAEDTQEVVELDELHGLDLRKGRLNIVLLVGVNGTGKTTTAAKLAQRCQAQGYKVLLGAADTFRAAAIEQLEVWGQRLGIDVIRHQEGSDPAAVVFDALNAAKARKTEVLFIDTAGRLQSKTHLMEELRKIRKVIQREVPDGPHEVLLVLDATTGQNGLQQAKVFQEVAGLTGSVLCKLDGTAKGGVVVAIIQEFKIPVKFIGVGERLEDLKPFQAQPFLAALFGETTV